MKVITFWEKDKVTYRLKKYSLFTLIYNSWNATQTYNVKKGDCKHSLSLFDIDYSIKFL